MTTEGQPVTTPLSAEELTAWRRVHVGDDGPFTAETCYNCWQQTCPVPRLLATLDATLTLVEALHHGATHEYADGYNHGVKAAADVLRAALGNPR